MVRRYMLLTLLSLLAATVLLPSVARAEDLSPSVSPVVAEESAPTDAPFLAPGDDDEAMSLEEAADLFGAHNVCGATCGYVGSQSCFKLCGDAAGCVNHRCIWF